MNSVYYLGVVLLMCAANGSALECYNCTWNDINAPNLNSRENCEGPIIGAEHVITCPDDKPYCYTQNVRTVIPSLNVDSVTIIRSCSESNLGTCLDIGIGTTCTEACSTDLCNTGSGGTQIVVGLSVSLLAVFASVWLQY